MSDLDQPGLSDGSRVVRWLVQAVVAVYVRRIGLRVTIFDRIWNRLLLQWQIISGQIISRQRIGGLSISWFGIRPR